METIKCWLGKYGNGSRGKVIRVEKPEEVNELKELKRRMRRLEAALADANIDLALTREGFLYLALLTDKYSRKIVGYHCADTLEAVGCCQALEMALRSWPAGSQPIYHTDRGSQYCSHEYVKRLRERGLPISMTERNHAAENALAERVNGLVVI